MFKNQTIASISTALSPAGIGIIRISGDEAIQIVDKIFISKFNKSLKERNSHTLTYGNIVDKDKVIDEVLVSIMKGPKSYTAEDVVEINSHGSILNLETILELVIKNGARLAEPGEFTKRAFLNGRLDLTEAEAVMDIIDSKTKLALSSSVNQLGGSLKRRVDKMRDDLISLIAHIEVSIDYPEYDAPELSDEKIEEIVRYIHSDCEKAISTYKSGKIVKEGINTAIIGKPNVGKSTLLNSLSGEEKAIVTNIAGTTRDSLEVAVNIEGIPLNIIDTAGIRLTDDIVESIGIDRSKKAMEKADLVLFIVDSSSEIDENDKIIAELIKHKKVIVLVNKVDISNDIDISELSLSENFELVKISAKEEIGLDDLRDRIKSMFLQGDIDINDDLFITNIRHKNAFNEAKISLSKVLDGMNMGMPVDLLSIDIKDTLYALDDIVGEKVSENVVDEIFGRFCLGK